MNMKIFFTLILLIGIGLCLRPPAPYCRQAPLPSMIPIGTNTTIRYDVQTLFDGYNLQIKGPQTDHIHVTPKYEVHKKDLEHSFNFSTAKIKRNNRFLGLIINDFTSKLVIGTNDQNTGVKVDTIVQVQDVPNLHCYDVEQIYGRDRSFAIIDCASFKQGQLTNNHFIFVDLSTGTKIMGGQTHDTFVKYNYLSKRNIQVIQDPYSRLLYVLRIISRDGVNQQYKNKTYIQIFLIRNAIDPQIIDVIDHTIIGESIFQIADYQIIFNQLFVLAYNKGLYRFSLSRDQRIQLKSFFEIKMDMNKFKVDRIGFNDDLYIAITNGNQIYAYNWDIISPPKLIQKFGLPAHSTVEQLVLNLDFIIVTLNTNFDDKIQRKHWIFTKRSISYTHAYNVFDAPPFGPAIMQFQANNINTLHLFHQYTTYNIKLSLPYLQINPVNDQKAGQKQQYTISATSYDSSNAQNNVTCQTKLTLIYQTKFDNSIIKTGFMDKIHHVVDSPDQYELDLSWEFYGRNLSYDVTFQVNSSLVPHVYIDKVHKALFQGIDNLKPQNIVWYEVFQQTSTSVLRPSGIYALVQQITLNQTTSKIFTQHYIHCDINVVDRDQKYHLSCKIISSTRFNMGRIIKSSQMFDPKERRLALVFQDKPDTVMIFQLWNSAFRVFGKKVYNGDAWNILTGVTISKGKLFCTLENSKKIEVYNLQDLRSSSQEQPSHAEPLFVINSQVIKFFGVNYWAPVSTKVSPFHDQVLFVKTKIGIMAINVNQMGFPELLFQIQTLNIRYDFQVNEQNLIIISQDHTQAWTLYTPLRRSKKPFVYKYINYQYKLGQYDQLTSDKLFYIVGPNDVIIVHPGHGSNNDVYLILNVTEEILTLDAVNIQGRQLLFIHTKSNIQVYVIRQRPTLYVGWPAHQHDFNLTLKAHNMNATSQPYNLLFNVLQNNQTQIKPSQYFNETQIKKLGHMRARENQNKTFTFNVTLNDSLWFQGNVFHYSINCTHCGDKKQIKVRNHVEQVGELVTGRAIYDMQSNFDGIFAQQYDSYFKTWAHNDSIQYIQSIPTVNRGQVCSKIAISDSRDFVISLCQAGNQVNVYLTSLVSDKPFTLGPYPTQAKAVNHAKIVDDILMIVDNQDDPFARNGGIYLYSLTFSEHNQFQMSMIDFVDNQDLRIQGYHGMGSIGSADLHDSHGIQQYRLFITDTASGNLFIFSFQLSPNRQQIVYLSKKLVQLSKLFPVSIKTPTPFRVLTVNIHYYISYPDKDNICQYYLLFTVSNWHHFELLITLDKYDNIKTSKVLRMFERIPWKLVNYIKIRRSWERSQFAVPYIDVQQQKQLIAIYEADFIVTPLTLQEQNNNSLVQVPLLKLLGVHRVRDAFEVVYAFHSKGLDTLLFTDFDGYNITQLSINPNVTLVVENLAQPENVTITAHNPFSNYTFTIQVQYIDQDQQQRIQIMWYILVALGSVMIVSLICIYAKQKSEANKSSFKKNKLTVSGKQSLITVEDKFKEDYINRTSVDPQSIRNTVDYGLTDSLLKDSTPVANQQTTSQMRREQ